MIMTLTQSPIRILFLAAIPHDIPPLKLGEECRAIDQALRLTDLHDKFDLNERWTVRVDDLQELLMRHKPHIVHFSGHGSSANELIFQDAKGNPYPLSTKALGRLFSLLKDNIQCVVLNACYSEHQAQEIAKCIGCVVGMSDAISDDAAIKFSIAFYRALGFGRDVKTAFELGRLEIELHSPTLAEHLLPRLLTPTCNPSMMFVLHSQEVPGEMSTKQNSTSSLELSDLQAQQDDEYWTAVGATAVYPAKASKPPALPCEPYIYCDTG